MSRERNTPLGTIVLLATVSAVASGVTMVGLRMFDRPGGFARACLELMDSGAPSRALFVPFSDMESPPDLPDSCVVLIGPLAVDADLALAQPPELLNGSNVLGALFGVIPQENGEIGTPDLATAHFLVDERGTVQQQRIARSSGYEALDEALLGTGPLASFSPAETDDGPTALWVEISAYVRANR